MKNILFISLINLNLFLFSAANAANPKSTDKSNQANFPATISSDKNLEFGMFTPGNIPGTIDHQGVTTGGVTAIIDEQNRTPATFTISGGAICSSFKPNFSLPETVTLTRNGGTETMKAILTLVDANSYSGCNNSGIGSVKVSGNLLVGSNQLAGLYFGTYNISVNY